MQKIPTYCQGSSIALVIRARDKEGGSPVAVTGYDLDGVLYTRLVGQKIRLSTSGEPKVAVHALDQATFAANIPAEMTSSLPPGECTLQLTFTDKTTGTKHVTVRKLMILEYAVK